MSKDIDMRHIGQVMGMPIYIDVSQIPDIQVESFKTKYTERDRKVTLIQILFQQMFAPLPPPNPFGTSRVKLKKELSDEEG